ncbi:MAG: PAS domain S-box protein [Acidobacteria bacterium]|nr:MAG: PAS domain S-box protein [Acidobacteriota bacterium]
MKNSEGKPAKKTWTKAEIDDLVRRVEEAEETLRAIREGEVDAIIVSGERGERVYSLAGSEQVYRLIVETMKEAALTVTLEGTILFCNEQFGQFLGLNREEILGHGLQEFVAVDQRSSVRELIARSASQPVRQRLVFQSERKPSVPAHISSNVLNQPDGLSICIVATDLTELETSTEMLQQLRRQQEALLASEARLRAVFAASQDAIVITDDDGRYVEINPAASRIHGVLPQDLIGRRLSEFIDPEVDLPGVWTQFKEEGCYQDEVRVFRPDGGCPLVEVLAVANIRPGRHLAVMHDITERRQAEEALKAAHRDLEQKVNERTAELAQAVDGLQAEIGLRREAESQLQTTNRFLRMLSDCNEAIVRVDDEQELMKDVCNIIVNVGGYRMAWVGMREYDSDKTVRPVAWTGFDQGYLASAGITWAKTERGLGPTGTAIRTGKMQTGFDFLTDSSLAPWREQAIKRGFRSSISLPLKEGTHAFGALTIYTGATVNFTEAQIKVLGELAEDLAFGIIALRTRRALRESRDRLRALAGELTLAEQRERQRLSKILHDHIQQLLVGAKYRLHAFPGTGTDATKKRISAVEELLDECIKTSRTLTAELSPPILQDGGLCDSLEWLAEWMADKYGLTVDLSLPEATVTMAQDLKLLLFESVRELLFNVVKHARAESATVGVKCLDDDTLEIMVADNGAGFDAERLNVGASSKVGFGLFSIRQRMELIGGQMEITSEVGHGTRLSLTIPLNTFSAGAV